MKLTKSNTTIYTLVLNEEEAAKLKGILGAMTNNGEEPLEEVYDQLAHAEVPDTYEMRFKITSGRTKRAIPYLVKLEEEDR